MYIYMYARIYVCVMCLCMYNYTYICKYMYMCSMISSKTFFDVISMTLERKEGWGNLRSGKWSIGTHFPSCHLTLTKPHRTLSLSSLLK